MKFLSSRAISVVLLVAASASASALSVVHARRSVGAYECPTAQIVQSQTIKVGEENVNLTTYVCLDQSLRHVRRENSAAESVTADAKRSSSSDPLGALLQRDDALPVIGCKELSASQCQCDVGNFFCDCYNAGGGTPEPGDCSILADLLPGIDDPPTIIIQPDEIVSADFQTCRFQIVNFGPLAVEFCWDVVGITGMVPSQQCLEDGGVQCSAKDGEFEFFFF
ncbi:hypothetical protein SCHPADRAFT_380738 [Schizopora paradoxa]|uniref:Uncharacterized protein n=1 Tax=Schizopora paradoxa TaxID=27342 RepID=A0A0H2RMI9_9AGAM|nr:hypothetical protein SCHPADRAFT_380738 [Schizopora paradoxa]